MFGNLFSPEAITSMLAGFGIDVEELKRSVKVIMESGAAEKIIKAAETLERIEGKLDAILKRMETQADGKPVVN